MPTELYASMRVELLPDPRQASMMVAEISAAWAAMLEKIGLEMEATPTISETRTKAERKPRKPRLITTVPPPEAA